MKERELNIIKKALELFEKTTGIETDFQMVKTTDNHNPDNKVRITHENENWDFVVETKTRITRATALLDRLANMNQPEKTLIITEYATPHTADMLKKANMPFFDAAGNAYFNEPPVYVFIKGNKPQRKLKIERPKRLFKPSGLRIIFALLNDPKMMNRPYRDIAKEAGVALGTVGWVMNDLKERRFFLDMGKNQRKLLNFEKLLNRWVEAYPEQLRPKLIRERFRADDPLWWEKIDIREYDAKWGGEVAAAKLTGYLKPEKVIIFTNKNIGKLVLKNRLRKAYHGEIEILNPFWNFDYDLALQGIVPPLLIYADLLATGDDRNIETAGILHEKFLT